MIGRRHAHRAAVSLGMAMTVSAAAIAADTAAPLDGTTAQGDAVRLYPNGRWEYVDVKKAEAQRPAVEAHEKERSLEQGGLLGVGRKVKPGDPDYNRGSMGGKSR